MGEIKVNTIRGVDSIEEREREFDFTYFPLVSSTPDSCAHDIALADRLAVLVSYRVVAHGVSLFSLLST
jgi:hypothetical protein